jgi:hypothetical protein
MSRPLYETELDQSKESAVMIEVCKTWHCDARKLKKNFEMDFELLSKKGELRAICEVKCRNNTLEQYPTYMIAKNKIINGRKIAADRGVPAILFVHFEDDIMFIDMSEEPDHYNLGGRVDRNDPMDIEMMAHYRHDQLTPLYE